MTAGGAATDPSEFLRQFHTLDGVEVPAIVLERSGNAGVRLEWRNELGGLTFRVPGGYLKWSPRSAGIDLDRERRRLEWLAPRHPAPRVLEHGGDETAQWLISAPVPGTSAVDDRWRARRPEAIRAIADGLRAFHALPLDDVPADWTETWVTRSPTSLGPRPPIPDPVLVHGDACAPNTLVGDDGRWSGHVDLGDVAIGDRWADLAIASLSLDWNYGEGHQQELFDAYGIEPDEERITWYRALWNLES